MQHGHQIRWLVTPGNVGRRAVRPRTPQRFAKIRSYRGPDWVDWGVRIAGLLMDTEVQTFGPEEKQAALEWVKS